MVSSPPSFAGQPERSRNAKAQARHRAKRKAYIEHLEHSVSRLSSIAGVDGPSDQPLDRVRQLEQENTQLRAEVERLRGLLAHSSPTSPVYEDSSPGTAKRASFPNMASEPSYVSSTSSKPSGPSPQMRPIFTEFRTSSYHSTGSASSAHTPSSGYPSYGGVTVGTATSPTSSTSTGSPFSPSTTSPLALPGLKLPPASGEPRSYANQSAFSSSQAAGDQRGMLPSLSRVLPATGPYFSSNDTSHTYAFKSNEDSPSSYQLPQQHAQAFTPPSNYSFDTYGASADTWASSRTRT